jgi:hypothetical protein
MARWTHDAADLACEAWAFQWCCLFRREPERAKEYLGALRSTLGNVPSLRDGDLKAGKRLVLHAGARSEGQFEQHFPEVFLGYGLVVAVALKYAEWYEREVIYRHYLEARYDMYTGQPLKRWSPRKVLAARLGVNPATYANHLNVGKGWINSALCLDIKDLSIAREKAYECGSMENCL